MKYLTVKIEIDKASIAAEYAAAGDILVAIEAAAKGKVLSAEFESEKKQNWSPHRGGIVPTLHDATTG